MAKPSATRSAVGPNAHFQFVIIAGVVRGDVVEGHSATGEALCSFDLLVDDGGERALVPVSMRGRSFAAPAADEQVVVCGTVVKRFHRRGPRTIARTSVEAVEMLRSPRRAQTARLLARMTERCGLA